MAALLDVVKKGSTDRSVTIRIIDSTDGTPETGVVFNTSGIDLWYRREGAAKTSITEASLSALTDAHSDGGFLHVSDGEYRLDLPDAALATGANYVDIGGTVTGMVVLGGRIRLVNYDLEDAVRLGLTALPNAAADAAGGLPISDAGGLDLDGLNGRIVGTIASGTHNPQSGDAYARLGAPAGASTAADIAAVKVDTAATLLDTGTDGVVVAAASKTGYALSSAGVQAIWDALTSALTTVGSVGKRIADFLTGDAYARLGAPAGASIAADIAVIESQTDDIGVAGAGLTALGDTRLANLDATVSSRLATSGYTTPPTVGAIADQVWDEAIADHAGAGSTGAALSGATAPTAAAVADAVWTEAIADHSGTVGSTAEALNAAGSAGDPWVTALPGAYGAGSAGKILGDNLNATVSSRATPAQVATELGTYDAPTKAELDAAVAPLATSAGVTSATANLDATVSSRATPAQVATELATYDAPTKAELDSAVAPLALEATAQSILTDTAVIGVAGAGLTEAGGTGDHLTAVPWNASWDVEVQSEVADALEEAVADSVPADGSRPSVKQALYMLTQFMVERSVSSTTVTVKKPDGTSSLFTLTLNDATSPTSITRAS